MSRRSRRRHHRQVRRRRARWLPPLFALLGAVVASLFAPRILDALATPLAVDETDWIVLVPGLDEQVQTPKLGRGSRVGMGALSLVPHSFGRSDRLLPRDPRPIARLEIELRSDSAALGVNLAPGQGSQGGITTLMLEPGGWLDPSRTQVALPPGSAAVLVHAGGVASAQVGTERTPLVRQPEGSIELFAVDGPVHLRRLRATDAAGATIVDADWTTRRPTPLQRVGVAVGGAGVGLLAGVASSGAATLAGGVLSTLPLLLLPWLVLALRHAVWLAAVERLFLVQTTTWELAGLALAAALLPLAGLALLRSQVLHVGPPERSDWPVAVWVVVAVGAAIAGARGLDGWGVLWAIPGALFLLAPLRFGAPAGLSRRGLLARDAPTLLAVAALGWPAGLLPAALWRLLLVIAQTPTLVARAPRAGSDVLFATLLALPLGVEGALRATYLGQAWSPERLSGATLGAGEDASGVVAYWTSSCGEEPAEVWWFGGSSAGGAYQLGGQPEAFFPGQVHAALCDAGLSVRSTNFSNGGRDTFTFSRALPELLADGAPDLVVVYTGVNDILTANSALTRAQREDRSARAGVAGGGLRALAGRSRVVAGLGLLARPVQGDASAFVSAVPVPDARDNLTAIAASISSTGGQVLLLPELTRPLAIAASISSTGGQVLLLPELTRPLIDDPLVSYRGMQADLGEQVAAVAYFDVVGEMHGADPEVVFVDRNHLSKAGHAQVASHLAPVVARLLAPGGP